MKCLTTLGGLAKGAKAFGKVGLKWTSSTPGSPRALPQREAVIQHMMGQF
ncbi:hypothetical protein ACFWHV_05675 [Streptomyces collinus]